MKKFKILVVDDHPLVLNGLKEIFLDLDQDQVDYVTDLEESYTKLEEAKLSPQPYEVLFTDLSFDNQTRNGLRSGEDLLRQTNQGFPGLKRCVITSHMEASRIYTVIKNLFPDAYLLKVGGDKEEIKACLEALSQGKKYYSKQVEGKLLQREAIEIKFDDSAVQILTLLQEECKISNMVGEVVNSKGKAISQRSIDGKLSDMRNMLRASNNIDLVLKAKELGIID